MKNLRKHLSWIEVVLMVALMLAPLSLSADESSGGSQQLDDVVVTATKYETSIKDIPASVSVITREELLDQNLPNGDIADALRSVAGISIRRAYAPFPASANIRGLGSGGTVYLVNGIPTDWQISQTIAVEMVERIEIIRGPASALYGANATGGVINVILKKGGDENSAAVSGGIGSFDRYRGAVSADGTVGDFEYAAAGFYEDVEGTNVVENNVNASVHMIDDCNYDKRGAGFNAAYQLTDQAKISGFYNFFNDQYTRGRPYVGGDWDYHMGGLMYDQSIGSRLSLSGYLAVRSDDYLHLYDMGGTNYNPRRKRYTDYRETPAELRATFKAGWGNTITAGVFYNNQETDQEYKEWFTGASQLHNEYKVRTLAGYLQDDWKVTSAMTVTAGLRYDYWKNYDNHFSAFVDPDPDDRTDEHISPKLGLRYNFASGTSLWGNYSTGFLPPTSEQLYDDRTSGGNPRQPNPDLEPETTHSFEVGAEQWFGTKFKATLVGFYNYTDDKIVSWFDASNVWINKNIGRTESYGAELDMALYLTERWAVTANYTYNEATIEDNPMDPTLEGNYLPFSPKHKANLGVTYRWPRNFSVSAYARYLSKQYSDDANTRLAGSGDDLYMEESFVVDLKATKYFPVSWGILENIAVSLSVDNVFDEEYRTMYMYEDPGTTYYAEVKFVI
jgi:iron complex outermembrane receptor protein